LPTGLTATFSGNASNGSITINGTPTQSGSFNYTIPLTGGCGNVNATGTITVTPNNTVTLSSASGTNPQTRCINTAIATITFATTGATGIGSSTGLPPGVTASWSNNIITISGTPTAAGTFNYAIPLVGGCGTLNATGTIIVNNTTLPSFAAVGPYCSGSSIPALPTSSTNSPTSITGTWSPAINNLSTTTYTFTPSSAQVAAPTCALNTSLTISIIQPTTPIFNQVGPFCVGSTFSALPNTSNNGIAGTWSPAINNSSTTTYTFTPNSTAQPTCAISTQQTITINPLTTPTFTQAGPYCAQSNIPALPSTSTNGIVGSWSPSINNTTTGTYTFTPSSIAAPTCATITNMTITITPLHNVSFVADTLFGCAPLTVNFTNTSGNPTNCSWSLGSGQVFSGCNANYTFNQAGCFDITLTSTENGCANSLTLEDYICVDNPPQASFTVDPTVFSQPSQNISFNNTSIGATSYFWDFGDDLYSNAVNPDHLFENTIEGYTVTLTATSDAGCTDQQELFIEFNEGEIFYVPNSFTPDGDGFNQTFKPIFTSGFDPFNFEMFIYNRWGELIFETHDANRGWDGSYGMDGRDVQQGVYTYKITYKNPRIDERKTVVGHITLIK
jgi:gliding motility-associated-like protein